MLPAFGRRIIATQWGAKSYHSSALALYAKPTKRGGRNNNKNTNNKNTNNKNTNNKNTNNKNNTNKTTSSKPPPPTQKATTSPQSTTAKNQPTPSSSYTTPLPNLKGTAPSEPTQHASSSTSYKFTFVPPERSFLESLGVDKQLPTQSLFTTSGAPSNWLAKMIPRTPLEVSFPQGTQKWCRYLHQFTFLYKDSEETAKQLSSLLKYEDNRDIVIQMPKVVSWDTLDALEKAPEFTNPQNMTQSLQALLNLLIPARRISLIFKIAHGFLALEKHNKGEVDLAITTPSPIAEDSPIVEHFKNKLGAKSINLSLKTDESIWRGYRLTHGKERDDKTWNSEWSALMDEVETAKSRSVTRVSQRSKPPVSFLDHFVELELELRKQKQQGQKLIKGLMSDYVAKSDVDVDKRFL